ncbi:MAG TPA: radical SAM protein [Acidimicrobiales bacterium]|nr:radical SAM protein [Acidimicrobiales bacterium]
MTRTAPACRAPSVSMYLDPLGVVRPCCVNPFYVLGRITEQSLADIWNGERTRQLRERLGHGDLSGGCDACRGPDRGDGEDHSSFARTFDVFPLAGGEPDVTWPVQLELALSNTCNLQCTMCSGTLSSAIRAGREGLPPLPKVYDDRFFEELRPFLAHAERVTLLGGEPLLARETWRVVDLLEEVGNQPRLHVTTNGMIWNDKVERLLTRFPTDVVVSVDAVDPDLLRSIRIGIEPERVMANLERFWEHAPRNGGSLAIACCLMTESAPDLRAVLALADRLDVDVFLNDVAWPAVSAYWSLDHEARAALVADLRSVEALGPPLHRNAAVWEDALSRIEAAPEPVAVELRVTSRSPELGPPVRFEVNDKHQLVAIEPDPSDVFGVDLTAVVGTPVGEFREPFHAVHGPLLRSQVQRNEGGSQVWTLDMGSPEAVRRLRATFEPGATTGGTWVLTLHELSPIDTLATGPVAN